MQPVVKAVVQGLRGWRIVETWYRTQALLKSGALDLSPLITYRILLSDFERGMELLLSGDVSKVMMHPHGVP